MKFLLSELRKIRLVCQGTRSKEDKTPCGGILEPPLDRLGSAFQLRGCTCPLCGNSFQTFSTAGTGQDPFAPLVKAVTDLQTISDRVEVQFVIPADEYVFVKTKA